ncbi:unnamed protein product [Rhodiola kirilowii]
MTMVHLEPYSIRTDRIRTYPTRSFARPLKIVAPLRATNSLLSLSPQSIG